MSKSSKVVPVLVDSVSAGVHGAVPVVGNDAYTPDGGSPIPSTSGQTSANHGVAFQDWGAYSSEVGIPEEMVATPVQEVDEGLIVSLQGVDVQVHGIDNRPQIVIPDAGLKSDDEANGVSQETPAPETAVGPVAVVFPVEVETSTPPKRMAGRPRKG